MTRETRSIQVVHVVPTAFGREGLFGGGERYPLELARAMAALDGVRCRLVTFGDRARVLEEDSGLRVEVLRARGHIGGHPAHPFGGGLIRALEGADVVHTHHMRSAPSRVAAVAARARRRRVVVTDHGLGGGDWLGVLPALFHRMLAVSEYSASLLDVPASRVRVVYGGVDPARFAPAPGEARAGVLFVGRLTPHKGVDRLLRALPDGAALTIVGTEGHDPRLPERAYPDHLRALAAGRDVRFLEPVGDDELGVLYRRAAVVVVPSVHVTCYGRTIAVSELLGLTAIEAMASGTPVVASRLGGLREVVDDGETGFLVEPGDVDALHDRLARVLSDPPLARALGERAAGVARERFTWEACARRCVEAYRELR